MRKLFIYYYGVTKIVLNIAELGGIHFQGDTGNDWLDMPTHAGIVFVFGIRNIQFNKCMHLLYLRYNLCALSSLNHCCVQLSP